MRVIEEMPTVNPYNDKTDGRIIGWISGGVASAVACKLTIDHYGADRVTLAFCDTSWEHPDTERFLTDLENYFDKPIVRLKSERFNNPEEVMRKYIGINFAHGAPCSMVLKKEVRIKYQELDTDFAQVFGFDFDKKEMKRATNMLMNNPDLNPIFPLINSRLDRRAIFYELKKMGIKEPEPYKHFLNNNCIGTTDKDSDEYKNSTGGLGCIQGGIGYWQKIKVMFSKKYDAMSKLENEITLAKYEKLKAKGELDKFKPVTICKNQQKGFEGERLFLKHNPRFPDVRTIDIIKGKQPITAFECNGFCSTIQGDFLNE